MKIRRVCHKITAVLALSVMLTGTCSFSARANALDDAKKFLFDLKDKVVKFLDDSGIAPTVKDGYNAAVDFIVTYETQPDDVDMSPGSFFVRWQALRLRLPVPLRSLPSTFKTSSELRHMLSTLPRIMALTSPPSLSAHRRRSVRSR